MQKEKNISIKSLVVFLKDRFCSRGNNPLHQAVLENDQDKVKLYSRAFLDKKNSLGLTPEILAKLLNRAHFFSSNFSFKIQIEAKDGLKMFTKEEFEQEMEVEYLPTIVFEKFSYVKKVIKRCQKVHSSEITKEQEWLGVRYEKELSLGYIPNVRVKWIDPCVEYGLFTNIDLHPFDYIGEYTGVVRKSSRHDAKNAYCFEYYVGDRAIFTVDARDKGNFTRFINHSDDPNLTPILVYASEVMHIVFRANRFIPKGSQLTYNYGPSYWRKREAPEKM